MLFIFVKEIWILIVYSVNVCYSKSYGNFDEGKIFVIIYLLFFECKIVKCFFYLR